MPLRHHRAGAPSRRRCGISFWEAFWATRAGNVFTTHTPVAAGFDRLPARTAAQIPALGELASVGVEPDIEFIALGRLDDGCRRAHVQHGVSGAARLSDDAWASAGCMASSAGGFSSRCFRAGRTAKCRWGTSPTACTSRPGIRRRPTDLWTEACGKDRWRAMPDDLAAAHGARSSDEKLWAMRGEGRQRLVERCGRICDATCASGGYELGHVHEADTRARPERSHARVCAALHRIQAAESAAARSVPASIAC